MPLNRHPESVGGSVVDDASIRAVNPIPIEIASHGKLDALVPSRKMSCAC